MKQFCSNWLRPPFPFIQRQSWWPTLFHLLSLPCAALPSSLTVLKTERKMLSQIYLDIIVLNDMQKSLGHV